MRGPFDRTAVGRGTLGEAGRARPHTYARERRVSELCQLKRAGAAVGRAGQVVESTWVDVWGLRGTREAAGIHLGYRWRANFDVARHEWCDLA